MSPSSRPRLEHSHKKEIRPASNRVAQTPVATNDPDIVWGAKAIGAVIGRNERQSYHLLEHGALKGARKIGGIWTAKRSLLLAQWDEVRK